MSVTPMMQQYLEAKRVCPDALLLFRMGDFYELFHDDARTAARLLNLSLTSREKGDSAIPMAGFPHQALENYLRRLIAAGQRVAIADQVEDPKQAKGLVKREVTRIVSAGTLTEDTLLDPRENNYLAAVSVPGSGREPILGLAWVDVSTGRFCAAEIPAARLADELARIAPVECLLSEDLKQSPLGIGPRLQVTKRPGWAFAAQPARDALRKQFGTASLEGFGWEETGPAIGAAGALLDYLVETQKSRLPHLDRLLPYSAEQSLQLDVATRRSLELTRTMREGRREGSLLGVLDQTVTAPGARLLGDWLAHPLTHRATLHARLDAVGELREAAELLEELRDMLRGVYDVERLVARVTTGRATPRDLSFLNRTLRLLPKFKAKLAGRQAPLLRDLEGLIDLCPDLRGPLDAALEDDCPLASREGGFIRAGYHPELDQLRDLAAGGKQWIARYQAEESARTGISSLKVGYNKVFGYYLEITNLHAEKVPPQYIRKQTVKNAERYITPELKEYEEKVLTATEKSKDLEYELFQQLRDLIHQAGRRLQATARALATLDLLASFAHLARQRNYCRPELIEEPRLEIVAGRHPVLDLTEAEGTFVPNDTTMDTDQSRILLITGPNMAGKSTYIRQVALLTFMAQLGSFVPAQKAVIGIADRIFARVGASDELARGQSTFMVEMTETARILHLATPRSLVILDEIGRGTSTYDGVSLAWAIVEYLHGETRCRTLFATHYHELTQLGEQSPGVKNLTVSVQEWQDDVVFLHQIVPGAADKSYGIHVARLAGVPKVVIERARTILRQLESGPHVPPSLPDADFKKKRTSPIQLTLFSLDDHPLLDKLRALDLDNVTPLQALQYLKTWQADLGPGN